MSLVVFDRVSLHLGGKPIVEDLALRIAERDRIGLIGPNGSGKSTLLRMMVGEQTPDGGAVRVPKSVRLGYLPQDVSVASGRTLMDFIRESVPGRKTIEADLAETEAALGECDATTEAGQEQMMELAQRVADLHEGLARFETQFSDHEAQRILTGLRFREADLSRDMGEFSGGWKMRAVLASLLFQQPDLLLLDEPTNHLDMPSVAWLSAFLKRYERAFVLISHDAEFLNEQIERVVTFEMEGVRSYPGDLHQYRRQRAEEEELLRNRQKNVEREREQLERFVKRFRAKATKAAQVQSRVKKLEQLEDVKVFSERAAMRFRFPPTERTGKDVLEANGIDKRYGDLEVLRNANLRLARGQRVAIIGENGAGKTTLLRILAGELEASGGTYEYGHKVKPAYFAQHHADVLPKNATVYDAVKMESEGASHETLRAALGAMLFGDLEIEKRVVVLSGGERARVALARLLVAPGNLLLLDEPTNHLDLESSERLAEAIDTFDGTLLFVSHNRAFIRALANTIWSIEDGEVRVYPGSFDDYLASCAMRDAHAVGVDATAASPGKVTSKKRDQTQPRSRAGDKAEKRRDAERRRKERKVLRPLEKRVGELESTIARLEKRVAELTESLSDPSVYEDAKQRSELTSEMTRAQAELDVANETWMETQEELDAARASLENDG